MEVKIGVQNVAREIILESTQKPDEIAALVGESIDGGKTLQLTDERGRLIVVPAQSLAYIEIGAEETRKVGFGSL